MAHRNASSNLDMVVALGGAGLLGNLLALGLVAAVLSPAKKPKAACPSGFTWNPSVPGDRPGTFGGCRQVPTSDPVPPCQIGDPKDRNAGYLIPVFTDPADLDRWVRDGTIQLTQRRMVKPGTSCRLPTTEEHMRNRHTGDCAFCLKQQIVITESGGTLVDARGFVGWIPR